MTAAFAVPVLFSAVLLVPFAISCAGGPSAESIVRDEARSRTYERFKADHELEGKDDLENPGIYYDGKTFYIVMGLSDSGTDRFPEWACDTFLTGLYGYHAADQRLVSDEEFFEFVLDFSLDDIIEDKYSSRAVVSVKERFVLKFLENYAEEEG
jgi:hypothetical protein